MTRRVRDNVAISQELRSLLNVQLDFFFAKVPRTKTNAHCGRRINGIGVTYCNRSITISVTCWIAKILDRKFDSGIEYYTLALPSVSVHQF